MQWTTLVDVETLSAHLNDPSVAVVDCRFDLANPSWGAATYAAGHVPGAAFADLERDLSGSKTGTNGRHPLPAPSALAATFGRWGIDRDVQVVAYDQDSGMYASRLWWLLRWLGHDRVAVLDGGAARWATAGGRMVPGVESRPGRTFIGAPRAELLMTADDVAARRADPAWRLVDARAPERFSGEVEPLDRVAGHIPGAANHFFMRSMGPDRTFLPASALRAGFQQTIGDCAPDRVVCYCGSGVTACHVLLALEHAGLVGARLYAGSWSEWSSDPSRPIGKGRP